jgi:hypothetical protein
MVEAGLPERVEAAHPVPAGQDVLQRVVEGMAHVQRAGDVRRRDHDAEGLGTGRVGTRPEGARLSHAAEMRGSASAASKVFSIGMIVFPSRNGGGLAKGGAGGKGGW